MTERFVHVELDDGLVILTFDRQEQLNAWHEPMRQQLVAALRPLNDDKQVRAVIMTGAGERAFCAGQDLAESETFDAVRAERWVDEFEELYDAVRAVEKPIVAALNGVAAGSGFQVALMCDVRVGHTGVQLGQTEVSSGLPSITGPWLMAERLGLSRTVELALTGRLMDAAEAQAAGLLHYVVPRPEVMPKAIEVARQLAAQPPIALRLTKRRFRQVTEPAFRDAFAAARELHHIAYASGEPQAEMRKFFEVRAARKTPAR